MSFYDSADAIYGSGEYGAASFGRVTPIVSLSSVSATAQLGSANPVIAKTVTGVSATGQVGAATFANDTTAILSSATATGTAGSVATALNTYVVTVANDGSNNVYYIRGVAKPTLTFNRGNTYTFDLSDSSNLGHPLAFKDALGNSYTTGVTSTGTPGTSGAKVTIEVDARTFSSLRYYCTVHGNVMGNTISVNYDAAYVAIYGLGEYGKARYGIAFAVTSLTGVQATGSVAPVQVNGFEIDIGENLDSVSATGSVGTVQVNLIEEVTGVQGAGQINSIVLNATQDLVGVVATGAINTVGIGNSARLAGVQGTGSVNVLAENVNEVLASVQGTGSVNLPAPSDAITVFSASAYSRNRTIILQPKATSSATRRAA